MTPFIHVVTPCYNAADTIDRTIHSVLSQAGDFRVHYHVQDGGSTDGTQARIAQWSQRLTDGSLPRFCRDIRLTWSSGADQGMYDALVIGMSGLEAGEDDFLTWINADDILMPGALAMAAAMGRQFTAPQLSWFGGSVCIMRDDVVTQSFDRPVTQAALRSGICDGTHWDFLQQEGTFFRKWLWDAVQPERTIRPMRLAGDWNLWRLMAQKADFAQALVPLAAFRISEGQLSARQRDRYQAEISANVLTPMRRASLAQLCKAGQVMCRRIRARDGIYQISDEPIDGFARHRYQTVFGATVPAPDIRWGGTDARPYPDISGLVQQRAGMVALDMDWQFPAITEQHAFTRLTSAWPDGLEGDCLYVAYPWATLIDKIRNSPQDADLYLDRFRQFCTRLDPDRRKVTVCQHIHASEHTDLFLAAGIRNVFWSHATHQDAERAADPDRQVRFHPFPLYPVQVTQALPEAGPDLDTAPRPYLFSFVGARANRHYLTQTRNWILDLLADDPRGLIVGRDSWHYQKIVYDLQIRGHASRDQEPGLVDAAASTHFLASLVQSTFSLCPAGTGPNSIRLWESLGAGSIPVILADSWAPPGDRRLWEMAAVFCAETPEAIRALPDRLADIAADPARLAGMRHAMRQLWLLYGPQSFVTDLQTMMLDHAAAPDLATVPAQRRMDSLLNQMLTQQNDAGLLRACAGAMLLNPEQLQARIARDAVLADALIEARASIPQDSVLAGHYDAVLHHSQTRLTVTPDAPFRTLPAPDIARHAPLKICLTGQHAHRTPLSYAPIRRLISDRLCDVASPDQADLVVTGFNIDLPAIIDRLSLSGPRTRTPKLVVLSEEPLWDITWSGPFRGREGRVSVEGQDVAYSFLGHETSAIYDFEQIPYFLLTSDSYTLRYAHLMARFAAISADLLLQRWQTAPVRAAFFAEHRKGDAYGQSFPERDVIGLSRFRTEVAEAAAGAGTLHAGKGWGGDAPRQALADWHLDKLARLDGRTCVLSAFENVHQRSYVSEKIFDAFAIGAIPTYWAGPNHRIHDLVPAAAMVNCHGFDAAASARKIMQITPDLQLARAWLATAAHLAGLFADPVILQAERRRVAETTLQELSSIA